MKWRDIFYLSWRNIRARSGYTLVIVMSLALVLAEVILVIALGLGFNTMSSTRSTSGLGQTITIAPAANQSVTSSALLLPTTLTKIKSLPDIQAVSGVMTKPAKVTTTSGPQSLTLLGVDSNYTQVEPVDFTAGRLPQKGEIALPEDLVATLPECAADCVGKTIKLLVTDIPYASSQSPEQEIPVKVSGIFAGSATGPLVSVNESRLFTINQPYASLIAKVTQPDKIPLVGKRIEKLGLAMVDKTGTLAAGAPDSRITNLLTRYLIETFEFVSMLVFVIVAFAVLALTLAQDRKDIASLRLIGAKTGDIIKLLTAETTILATLSGVVAALLSLGLARLAISLVAYLAVDSTVAQFVGFDFPPLVLGSMIGFTTLVGFLAGNYVGWETIRLADPSNIDLT